MNCKKLVLSIVAGGIVYLIVSMILSFLTQLASPFDWASVGGMRSWSDPAMMGYFFYGFVLCIGSSVLYQLIDIKAKKTWHKGVRFGALMWLVVSVPSAFVVFTTMVYPFGFYLENFFLAFVAWLIVGMTIACVNDCKCCKK